MKRIVLVLLLSCLLFVYWLTLNNGKRGNDIIVQDSELSDYSISLTDVRNIDKIESTKRATGSVSVDIDKGRDYFISEGNFDVPSLPKGRFYKGWFVKNNPHHFFSIGVLSKNKTGYSFSYKRSLSELMNAGDYLRFVVTVESDPEHNYPNSDHILEGGEPR